MHRPPPVATKIYRRVCTTHDKLVSYYKGRHNNIHDGNNWNRYTTYCFSWLYIGRFFDLCQCHMFYRQSSGTAPVTNNTYCTSTDSMALQVLSITTSTKYWPSTPVVGMWFNIRTAAYAVASRTYNFHQKFWAVGQLLLFLKILKYLC